MAHTTRQVVSNFLKKNRPIYSLILGSQVMIVLSSDVAVKDLLDKKSAIYSSRPESFIGQTIVSGGLRLTLMVSPDVFKVHCLLPLCASTYLSICSAPTAILRNMADSAPLPPCHLEHPRSQIICALPRPGEQTDARRAFRPTRGF